MEWSNALLEVFHALSERFRVIVTFDHCTGIGLKARPRLCECCRQSQAGVVRNSRNKIHQAWEPHFSQALYTRRMDIGATAADAKLQSFPLFTLPDQRSISVK